MTAKHNRQRRVHQTASIIYHICLVIYLVCQFARSIHGASTIPGLHTATTTIQQIVRYVLLGLCIEHCCYDPKGGFIRLGVMVLSLLASSNSSNFNNVFDFASFVLLSDLSHEKSTPKILLPVYSLMFVFLAWMTLQGRVYSDGIVHSVGVVHSFGMARANSTAALFAAFLILLWSLGLKRHKILSCLFFWAGAAIMYRFTVSLSICILIAVFPLIDIVVSFITGKKHSGILNISLALPVLLAALSIGTMFWLDSFITSAELESWNMTLRNFLTRFTNAAIYYHEAGISLLGAPQDRYITDNLYLNVLLCHGILGLALVVGVQTWMLLRILKARRYDLLAVQIMMFAYAMMETVPMALLYNFTFACLPGLLASPKAAQVPDSGKTGLSSLFHRPVFLRSRLIVSGILIVICGVLASFWPQLLCSDPRAPFWADEVILAAALLVVIWLAPWSFLKRSPDAKESPFDCDIAYHDVAENGFYWNLAIFMSALVLVVFVFHWTVAGDWNFTAMSSSPVNRTALLPQMDGTVEIRQTVTIQPDRLDQMTLGIASVSDTSGEESNTDAEGLHISLENQGNTIAQWQVIPKDVTATDLVLNFADHPVGLNGQQLTLVISGRYPVSLWYGNVVSAGKFEVKVDSDEKLTVNGNPVDGQLILVQSGVAMHSQSKYIWPAAVLLLGAILLLLLIAHQKEKQGKPFFLNTLRALVRKYRFLLHVLVARDFHVKYRSSSLGMVWSFLNPMLMALIYMFVFSTIFKNSIQNFIVYVMTGIVLFNYFSDATNLCMLSIVGNGGLITKVYIPKYIFPISKALSAAINLIISMVPLLLIMALTGVPFQKSLLLLPLVLIFLIIFTIGVGLMLSSALVFFRDIQFLWGIMVTILNFLSPVFYPESIIPAKFITIYHMNPMYQFLYFMRTITLGGVSPQPITFLYCAAASLLSLILGIWVFRKNQDRFVLYL